MAGEKQAIWFKNATQVHRYLTCEAGEEYIWGDRQVAVKEGLVFQVSQKTIYNHIDAALLKSRRGVNGFAKRTVDQYAKRELGDKVVSGAKGHLPETEEQEEETELDRSRRTKADADLKQIQAERARWAHEKELGKHVETATVERELGERAKAFRMGLEKWGHDQAERVAGVFGGAKSSAADLCAVLGLPEDKAQVVMDWAHGQADSFRRLWGAEVESLLDAYATGNWFDDEMRAAWERYEVSHGRGD